MSRNLVCVVALAAVAPLAVELPADRDSAAVPARVTRLRASGGLASYTFFARGCEGRVIDHVPVRARDASLSVEQDLGSSVRVGVRGGWTRDRIDTTSTGLFPEVPLGRTLTNRYVNPHVAFEARDAGVGAGIVFHEHEFPTAGEGARLTANHPANDFSAHVRFGREDRRHFAARWMESEPLYSGGGYLTLAMGGPAPRLPMRYEVGLAAGGPYEGAGLFLKTRWRLGSGVGLDVAGRGGASGAGASLGLSYERPW